MQKYDDIQISTSVDHNLVKTVVRVPISLTATHVRAARDGMDRIVISKVMHFFLHKNVVLNLPK